MKQIVVADTNMFIDLHAAGLLDVFFRMPWDVHTTDFVMLNLQREDKKSAVLAFKDKGMLHVAEQEFDEIIEINKLEQRYGKKTHVSLIDCSVWYYAKQNGYILLSCDRNLRQSATSDGVDVKGIRDVFDMMVVKGAISLESASEKLTLLKTINQRLSKDETEKRFKQWQIGKEAAYGRIVL